MRHLLVICGLALILTPAALAAKPTPVTGTLAVSGATSPGQTFTLSGCDYAPGAPLLVTIHTPFYGLDGQNVTADETGCFTTTWTEPYVGSYYADSYLIGRNGKSLVWAAEVAFSLS